MTKPFMFEAKVRKHIHNILQLMGYANSIEKGKWAVQNTDANKNGVYGAASQTLRLILTEVFVERCFVETVMDNFVGMVTNFSVDEIEECISHVVATTY